MLCILLLTITDPGLELFERTVRPMLVDHCISCHGGDKIRGGLVLSTPEGLKKGGDAGTVLQPGDASSSRLLEALEYHNPDFQMPPFGRLPESTIADVRRWIELGAPDPRATGSNQAAIEESALQLKDRLQHWAYRPMANEPPPIHSAQHPIDRFVGDKLARAGATPSPPAEESQLLRRLHLSLTGLPPTLEQLHAFDQTKASERFNLALDKLLDSPHYGERWARHWMDVARYADSNGLDENTAFANAWRWRDWVIQALNDDLPYDQFVTMQLAGDLLPPTDNRDLARDRIIATGFLGLGPKVLAEPDKAKMRADIVDEQLDTVGKTFLGQTIGCARCHDHKFDPIPARDYYAMAGIMHSTQTMATFNTVARVLERPAAHPEVVAERKAWESDLEAAKSAISQAQKQVDAGLQDTWLTKLPQAIEAVAQMPSSRIGREAEAFDRSNLNQDFDHWGPGIGVIHTTRPTELQFVEWDVEVPASGRWTLALRYASAESRPLKLIINGTEKSNDALAAATGSFYPDTQRWVDVYTGDWPAGSVTIRLERPASFPHIDRIVLRDTSLEAHNTAQLDAVAQSLNLPVGFLTRLHEQLVFSPEWTQDPNATQIEIRSILQKDRTSSDGETDSNQKTVRTRWLDDGPFSPTDLERAGASKEDFEAWTSAKQHLEQLQAMDVPIAPDTISVRDEPEPRSVKLHARGDHTQRIGEAIPRGFLQVSDHLVPTPPIESNSGRLDLALWMLHPEHPLTARVIVNRVWQGHFGVGLVDTPSDFGTRGGTPTHPELLDWLARWFIQDGWSLKRLHRLILTSKTWQQSSQHRPDMAQLDPNNTLLWRSRRRRYEAEAIRDAILTVSDGIDPTMGGSLLETDNFAYVNNDQSSSNESYEDRRRAIYLPVIRNDMYDLYSIFDYPDASVSFGKRPSTVVSSQALFFLNAPLVLEESERLAEVLHISPIDDALRELWNRAYARSPRAEERQRAYNLLRTLDVDNSALSAWTGLIQSVFASSEFIYLD